ncbi:hypothetical protein ACOSQ4_012425 [Xanthoceras sorbifolium]
MKQETHKWTRTQKRTQTWPPWWEVVKRAEKVLVEMKSESLKACSRENWILESESGSGNFRRVVVRDRVVVVAVGSARQT